eukprot:14887815-Alexandrium_andersonii.AAC.1
MVGDNPMWPWMIRHAGALISMFRKGTYGKTAYGRIRKDQGTRVRARACGVRGMCDVSQATERRHAQG